ncbi:hypothetical protein GCM10009544_20890 [Streptomyces stramineus]|uniref:Chaplin domain-containing protein n=1 Tax=Streptomyces stramineus TaxID=173861 RepID=A0ABN0ZT46_9ACTN
MTAVSSGCASGGWKTAASGVCPSVGEITRSVLVTAIAMGTSASPFTPAAGAAADADRYCPVLNRPVLNCPVLTPPHLIHEWGG